MENSNCQFCTEICDSGIFYCSIPSVDRGGDCKDCPLLNTDAISALACEIHDIKKWIENHDYTSVYK